MQADGSTAPRSLQQAGQMLAQRAAAGDRASSTELATIAKQLDVSVEDVQAALAHAIAAGVEHVEDVGGRTADHRAQVGDGSYRGQRTADADHTSALQGHNLNVDATAAADVLDQLDAAARAKAASAVDARAELRSAPTLRDLEAMRIGAKSPAEVASALRTALASSNPAVVKKAANTLRTAEAYGRKAREDAANYKGTGFWGMSFPKLQVRLNADETKKVLRNVVATGDAQTVGSMMLAAREGLLVTEPADAFDDHAAMKKLWPSDASAIVPGSHGREAPQRATFQAEYELDTAPGTDNIREVIVDTAKASGCPFARGNHAKGVSFGDGVFEVDKGAPDWIKDLVGTDPLQGAMMRISTSHSSLEDHDKEPAQTGVRLVFPVIGEPHADNSSTWDVTANTGSTTHRPNAREHTEFTRSLSTPRDGIAGNKVVRVASYLARGVARFNVLDRVKGIISALEPTKEAMNTPLHQQKLFARHTLFIGGRYVQVRYDVVEPTDFQVPDPSRKNGQLETKEASIQRHGVKLRIYMKELPPGADPELVEKEGWTNADLDDGQRFQEYVFGDVRFDAQSSDPDSAASKFFDAWAHIPGRETQLARGAGVIGRQRSPTYHASEQARNAL
ncbi:MAG: hypothetical protein RMA76_23695 [Deltaproteobacteria bacterium]|jgi:hypothetical protein